MNNTSQTINSGEVFAIFDRRYRKLYRNIWATWILAFFVGLLVVMQSWLAYLNQGGSQRMDTPTQTASETLRVLDPYEEGMLSYDEE